MIDRLFSLLSSIVMVALVTALVLPGRNTAGIFSAFFSGLTGWTKVAVSG